jgi:hypothetical protein
VLGLPLYGRVYTDERRGLRHYIRTYSDGIRELGAEDNSWRKLHNGDLRLDFTAVTMRNVVFLDIKPSSYLTGDILRLHCSVQPVNTTAVTMKSTVFWDIKTQFIPRRRHISATDLSVNAM